MLSAVLPASLDRCKSSALTAFIKVAMHTDASTTAQMKQCEQHLFTECTTLKMQALELRTEQLIAECHCESDVRRAQVKLARCHEEQQLFSGWHGAATESAPGEHYATSSQGNDEASTLADTVQQLNVELQVAQRRLIGLNLVNLSNLMALLQKWSCRTQEASLRLQSVSTAPSKVSMLSQTCAVSNNVYAVPCMDVGPMCDVSVLDVGLCSLMNARLRELSLPVAEYHPDSVVVVVCAHIACRMNHCSKQRLRQFTAKAQQQQLPHHPLSLSSLVRLIAHTLTYIAIAFCSETVSSGDH